MIIMNKVTYQLTLQAYSSHINDLIDGIKAFQKECRADNKNHWATNLDYVLYDLEKADTELCIELDQLTEMLMRGDSK